jgi:hypothetical protein
MRRAFRGGRDDDDDEKTENGDDEADAGEPSFTSTEINSDGTTLVATWVWREGYVVDDV